MSITVTQSFGRRYTSEASGKQSAVREYIAISSTAITDLDDLITDALTGGLPALGDAYSVSAPYLIAVRHIPSELEMEKKVYRIQVQYESDSFSWSFPTSQPWIIEFYSVQQEIVPIKTTFDSTGFVTDPVKLVTAGQPILNTAGFPFVDPPVTDFRVLLGIRLSKNVGAVTDIGTISTVNELMGYVNSVNNGATSSSLTIAGVTGTEYMFFMQDVNIRNSQQNGEEYFSLNFDVIYDPDRHISKVLNAGYQDKNGQKIFNLAGGDISSPWLLDINGDSIKDATAAARAAKAIYRGFGIKPTKD